MRLAREESGGKKGKGKTTRQTAGKTTKKVGGMAEWAEARTKEKRFRAVVGYDSNQLEQWIREAPAVGLWLANEMGKAISGVLDVGSHWLGVQAALKKPLPPEVLLVGLPAGSRRFRGPGFRRCGGGVERAALAKGHLY
jgi:hypothetical protein